MPRWCWSRRTGTSSPSGSATETGAPTWRSISCRSRSAPSPPPSRRRTSSSSSPRWSSRRGSCPDTGNTRRSLAVLLVTPLVIVLGEVVPKSFARPRADRLVSGGRADRPRRGNFPVSAGRGGLLGGADAFGSVRRDPADAGARHPGGAFAAAAGEPGRRVGRRAPRACDGAAGVPLRREEGGGCVPPPRAGDGAPRGRHLPGRRAVVRPERVFALPRVPGAGRPGGRIPPCPRRRGDRSRRPRGAAAAEAPLRPGVDAAGRAAARVPGRADLLRRGGGRVRRRHRDRHRGGRGRGGGGGDRG